MIHWYRTACFRLWIWARKAYWQAILLTWSTSFWSPKTRSRSKRQNWSEYNAASRRSVTWTTWPSTGTRTCWTRSYRTARLKMWKKRRINCWSEKFRTIWLIGRKPTASIRTGPTVPSTWRATSSSSRTSSIRTFWVRARANSRARSSTAVSTRTIRWRTWTTWRVPWRGSRTIPSRSTIRIRRRSRIKRWILLKRNVSFPNFYFIVPWTIL